MDEPDAPPPTSDDAPAAPTPPPASAPERPAAATPMRSHRNLRRLGGALLTLLIALAGVVGLLLLAESRDSSQVDHSSSTAAGPGQLYADQGDAHLAAGQKPAKPYDSDPPTSGPHVPAAITSDPAGTVLTDDQILEAIEQGNVVMLYGTAKPPAALRAVANQLAGPFDPSLLAAGQGVVLGRRPGTSGVVAVAWRHLLPVASASDPALEQFGDYWLGRGASG